MSDQQRPEPTPLGHDPAPTGWESMPTGPVPAPPSAPQPSGGPVPGSQATGWPPPPAWAGTPHGAAGHTQVFGPPGPSGPGGPGSPFFGVPAAPAPRRNAGRLRVGVAGLVAGALIGGGAGAGTVVLLDRDGGGAGTTTSAQEVVIENPETATTATAAAAKAAPSVVTLYVQGGGESGSGSGVVLTEDGFVLTNNHVVDVGGGSPQVQVRTADGTLYDAEVVGTEPGTDLAVVRLQDAAGLTPATFADSDEVQVGDVAVAIGAPLGLTNTVTDGIVSATNRAVQLGRQGEDATVIDAIQTDAAINPGNSGGALVNGAGEVIGINTAIATVAGSLPGSEQSGNIGVGFAIPSNAAERIATELIETGQARRALLGVSARTEAAQGSAIGAGARVVSVEPGSAAADAGLEPGDVITALDDRPITTSTELTAAVRSETPGEQIQVTVRRGDQSRTIEVTLGATD